MHRSRLRSAMPPPRRPCSSAPRRSPRSAPTCCASAPASNSRAARQQAAGRSCRAALERAPADVAAWNLLGEIANRSDPAAAESAWDHALSLDPRNAEASFHLGNCKRQRGAAAAAIAHYEQALSSAPRHAGVLNNLGLALTANRSARTRRSLLSRPARDRPAPCRRVGQSRHPAARPATDRRSGPRLRERGRHRARISRPLLDSARGCARRSEGDTRCGGEPAQAARLDPEHMPTQVDLGSLCVLQGNYAAAEVALQRALELDPDNAYAIAMAAYCQLQPLPVGRSRRRLCATQPLSGRRGAAGALRRGALPAARDAALA